MGADGEAKTKPIQHSIKQVFAAATARATRDVHNAAANARRGAFSHSAAAAMPCGAAAAVGRLKWDRA